MAFLRACALDDVADDVARAVTLDGIDACEHSSRRA
jgi:hypothetical protein